MTIPRVDTALATVADCPQGALRPFSHLEPKYMKNEKRAIFTILSLSSALVSFAQGNGLAGITDATTMVSSYFEPLTGLIYAIGAVVGLIGGVRVYSKFSSGDPDVSKTAAAWFGACIFLVVAATVLRSFFL